MATPQPNPRAPPPENPESSPKILSASFTTLLALGGLLFAIGTSEPGSFVSNKSHKKLLYVVGFSLGAIFYGLVFLSAKLKYPLYIWAALSVTWVTFWFGVNQDVHPRKDFIRMVAIINSILAALFVLKTLFHVGVSESLQFLKKNFFFWGPTKGFLSFIEKANPWLANCLGFASVAPPAANPAAAAAPPPPAAATAPPAANPAAAAASAPPAANPTAAAPRGGGVPAGHV